MVSSEVAENGHCSPDSNSCSVIGLPPGNYKLVGWDMDATGRKLIDEICQIAGYTENSSYSQYVMPYKNLNPVAMKRHKIKVVTIKKFRMLKDSKTNKMIKTKSEFSALTEFLNWLESVKGHNTDGVILIYHEPRKVIPIMLMESLHKYDFLDRFKKVVKGFANGFNIASAKSPNTARTYSLRMLSRSLLQEEEELGNAANRARLALQIVHHLSLKNQEAEEVSGSADNDHCNQRTMEFIREFIQPTDLEVQEHQDGKVLFQRQSSLRPIFGLLLRNINRRERQHVNPLRRLLAEAGIDYAQLQEIWANGQAAALEKFINEKLEKVDEKKMKDLMEILLKHFDPKEPSKDDIENEQKQNEKIAEKENGNDCTSENESPDTTTSNSGSSDDIPTSNSALNNNNTLNNNETKVYIC